MSLSPAAASIAADAVLGALNHGGRLRIMSGAAVLAVLPLPSPAFNRAIDGAATAHQIAPALAVKSGTATSFEVNDSTGAVVFAGRVGAELTLNRTGIAAGARVTIAVLTYTQQRG